MSWILEGDIKSFFDSIDHHLLADLLSKYVNDRSLIHIYWKLVRAGYIEWNEEKKFLLADKGVPQGGILSPLLSNLILHQFDLFIEMKKA
jgi:retron-type reverse transcriptase